MKYSIIVWGFDTDNDYQHDCDFIKAKNMLEACSYACNVRWHGWQFTRIDIEELKEYQYIVKYHDNYTNENGDFSCKADSALDAKIHFRLCKDFADTKRYDIISVRGVLK